MKIIKTLALSGILFVSGCTSSKLSQVERDVWSSSNYEVSCDGVGVEGTQLLNVASFGKDYLEAMAMARRDAVHAILFKGVQSSMCNVPALVGYESYLQYKTYFKSFFDSPGPYLDFVNLASDVPSDLVHIGGHVKAYSNVVVNRDGLRQQLVDAGILNRMGSEFDRKIQ